MFTFRPMCVQVRRHRCRSIQEIDPLCALNGRYISMRSSSSSRWRTLAILSLASAGWAFSFGLGVPLGSLWLKDAGYCDQVVGLSTSVYYLGVAGACLLLPWLMRRGCRNLVIGGLLVDAL